MRIEVKGRNLQVTDELRECVARRFEKVAKQVVELAMLEVELSEERNPANPTTWWPRRRCYLKGVTLRAKDASRDPKHSINLVADELARQVKRHRDKRRKRRESRAAAARPRSPSPRRRARDAARRSDAGARGAARAAATLEPMSILDRALRMGEAKQFKQYAKRVERINAWEPELELLDDDELRAQRRRAARARAERRVARRPAARDVRARPRGRPPPHGHAPLRRPDDRRHGAARRRDRRDEDRRGQDADRARSPWCSTRCAGEGVHVVTVNDYLARRDADWMRPIYEGLGLTVGVLQNMQPYEEKRAAYASDITYGTNSEFGFDYLRDNMATTLEEKVQHGGRSTRTASRSPSHHFAIVDEVDNILIDEARTPLIISGAPEQAADFYERFAKLAPQLEPGKKPEGMDPKAKKEFVADYDYEFDEKHKTVSITERGVAKAERFLGIDHLYKAENGPLVNHLIQSLKAESLYKRDVDYAVIDGEVKIIDEFTGRILDGRRWSEGLHQAVEAKEGVRVREENQTLATITLQNYFRMYDKLAGMTGTALTEATEFMKIYKLPVVEIPTNRPMVRADRNDQIFKTKERQVGARSSREIAGAPRQGPAGARGHDLGRGLRAAVGAQLKKRGIPHTVLNAKPEYAEREGEIIAEAGPPGAVTIATNMAGRGVDIKLGGNAEHLTQLELAKLGLQPGDPDYEERFEDILPTIEARVEDEPRAGARGRRPVHLRHRAPRVAPDRQPAARPLRPPGRSRASRASSCPPRTTSCACSPATASTASSTASARSPRRARRSRSRRRCSRSRSRAPSARSRSRTSSSASASRVRRRHEPAARDRLPLPRRGARGPRHGPGRARADRRRRSATWSTSTRPATTSRSGTSTRCGRSSTRSSRSTSGPTSSTAQTVDRDELKQLLDRGRA